MISRTRPARRTNRPRSSPRRSPRRSKSSRPGESLRRAIQSRGASTGQVLRVDDRLAMGAWFPPCDASRFLAGLVLLTGDAKLLLSMTGHGEARRERDGIAVAAEVRTINNKYFKLTLRTSDRYASLEPQVESVVRQHLRRGTVQIGLWIDRESKADDFRLNELVLQSYREQLSKMETRLGSNLPIRLEALLALPGVVAEQRTRHVDLADEWPLAEETLVAALKHLALMREDEGRAMGADLRHNSRFIAGQLDAIARQAPLVIEGYRSRILERLNKLLSEFDVKVAAGDIVREVGMFAERVDISEEIVRLRSHLQQFDHCMELAESQGRKLEFLTQEMFRETNTIGSKANDATLAQHVIEIKTAIERMREMIQNVE